MFLFFMHTMETTIKSKIVMTITVILAGICGALVLQAVAIIKYAVFWYFQRTYPGFAMDIESYVFPKILCVSVLSILAGIFLVISLWTVLALLKDKFSLSQIGILAVAVILTAVCGMGAVRCMQNVLQQPSFLAGRPDIWNEYQIHISSRVRPMIVFSVLTGGLLAVFFTFLRDITKSSSKTETTFEAKYKAKPEKLTEVESTESETKALNILKKRLNEGEITKEEYNKMKSVLEKK